MKILFFTLVKISSIDEGGIYVDMVREFTKRGHQIDYYFPFSEKINHRNKDNSINSIFIKQKFQKTNSNFLRYLAYKIIEYRFSRLIQKFENKYDLLILVTPSIFQHKIVKSFKSKFKSAKIILLLKDIFPDNARDLGFFKKIPFGSILFKYFKLLESNFYSSVDYIGCMNKQNFTYILNNYPHIKKKLFISYNSIHFKDVNKTLSRKELGIPNDKIIFIYTGNIGKPQGFEFFANYIINSPDNFYFIFIGSGTEESSLHKKLKFIPEKATFLNSNIDKNLIDQYMLNSNFGLILLNPNFKVPNFPSKLLTYINVNLPIIALTETGNYVELIIKNYDIGYHQTMNKIKGSFDNIITQRVFPAENFNKLKDLFSVEKQVAGLIKVYNSKR